MSLFFCAGCKRITNVEYCIRCDVKSQEVTQVNYTPEDRLININGEEFEISTNYDRGKKGWEGDIV